MLHTADQESLELHTPGAAPSKEEWAERLRAAGIRPAQRYSVEPGDFSRPIRKRPKFVAFLVRAVRRVL